MNFDAEQWLNILVKRVTNVFGNRVLFIGHTGSYARGEATEESDIDVNIVLDSLSMEDLQQYRHIVRNMPNREKACGFICGKKEIAAWPSQELFQFTQGCKILYGSLNGLINLPIDEDIKDNIRNIVSAIYHGVCHQFLYCDETAVEVENLKFSYKSTFYVLQEWIYLKKRMYFPTKESLLPHLEEENKAVLNILINWNSLKTDREKHPENYFETLKNWSSQMMQNVK